MFPRTKKDPMTLFTRESGTFTPVTTSANIKDRQVTIPGIMTCAALVISYKSNKDECMKIYAAHLNSGVPSKKMNQELEHIKQDAAPESITSIYWAGGENLDENYEKDIAKIDALLSTKTIARADAGTIIINLVTNTVRSIHQPEILTLNMSPVNSDQAMKPPQPRK